MRGEGGGGVMLAFLTIVLSFLAITQLLLL